MRILALDPSSTATGFAVAEVTAGFRVIHAHLYRPSRGLESWERVFDICETLLRDLPAWVSETMETRIVIETSSGKVNTSRHGGGGAGLAVYGQAVGAIVQTCRLFERLTTQMPRRIVGVPAPLVVCETERWTGGFSKDKRKRVAANLLPAYDPAADRGGDVADAICLANWYAIRRVSHGRA